MLITKLYRLQSITDSQTQVEIPARNGYLLLIAVLASCGALVGSELTGVQFQVAFS